MQQKLDNNGLMILDSTCSFSKRWPKHATIRIDKRKECNPDIVMDARDLKFPNNYFDEIYCDPPHLMAKGVPDSVKANRRRSGRLSPDQWTRYWFWENKEEWFDFIDKTNNEFFRCIKSNGQLYYKITEASQCTKPEDLIKRMTNFELVIDDITNSKHNASKKSKVHWMIFKPKSQELQSKVEVES